MFAATLVYIGGWGSCHPKSNGRPYGKYLFCLVKQISSWVQHAAVDQSSEPAVNIDVPCYFFFLSALSKHTHSHKGEGVVVGNQMFLWGLIKQFRLCATFGTWKSSALMITREELQLTAISKPLQQASPEHLQFFNRMNPKMRQGPSYISSRQNAFPAKKMDLDSYVSSGCCTLQWGPFRCISLKSPVHATRRVRSSFQGPYVMKPQMASHSFCSRDDKVSWVPESPTRDNRDYSFLAALKGSCCGQRKAVF